MTKPDTGGRGEGRSSDLVMVEREVLEGVKQFIQNGIELGYIKMPDQRTPDPAHDVLPSVIAALQSVEGGVQGSIATKQESCPEGAPRTETALEYGSIEDRIADATRDASESHKEDCNSYGAGYDSGYLAALIELRDDQLTKTPSAGHDDGNLRATGGEA